MMLTMLNALAKTKLFKKVTLQSRWLRLNSNQR